MAKLLHQVVIFLLSTIALAAVSEVNTDLNANGAFADLITVRASYFRSLCDANPLTWDQGLADIANSTIWSCDLEYDYWFPQGQIIFQMIGDHNQIINSPNATYFAVGHWYDLRANYTNITSDDYTQLEPFVPAWEFTEMVWKANTQIGCAYAAAVNCPDSVTGKMQNTYQLYCLLSPGGNQWNQWGAQVECKDCTDVAPQLSTINLATISWPDKRDLPHPTSTTTPVPSPPNEYVRASLSAAMKRVEKYLTMNNEEFMERWDIPATVASVTAIPTP